MSLKVSVHTAYGVCHVCNMQSVLNLTVFVVHESHFPGKSEWLLGKVAWFSKCYRIHLHLMEVQMLRHGFNTDNSSLWAATLV